MNKKHPLDQYLFLDFCQRNDWDPAWLSDCQDPDGRGWISEELADELERATNGAIPRTCWPRLRPEVKLRAIPGGAPRPLRDSRGRPGYSETHPLYVWLKKSKTKLEDFAKSEKLTRQGVSYYMRGTRPITFELAKRWERLSDGAVPWDCWPIVRRPSLGKPVQFWHFGKAISAEECRHIRAGLDTQQNNLLQIV